MPLISDLDVQLYLQVNRYKETLWFNKEAFEKLAWWLLMISMINVFSDASLSSHDAVKKTIIYLNTFNKMLDISEKSNFQLEKLLEIAKNGADKPDPVLDNSNSKLPNNNKR
jgi:hypothetical protein